MAVAAVPCGPSDDLSKLLEAPELCDEVDPLLLWIKLIPLVPKWRDMAISLGISVSEIESIATEYHHPSLCMKEVIAAYWRPGKQTDIDQLRQKLVDGISSPYGGSNVALAKQLFVGEECYRIDSRLLRIDKDLVDVCKLIRPIAYQWREIGLTLGIDSDVLDAMSHENFRMTTMFERWLTQQYNVIKHGQPSWRKLVEVVAHPLGGDNPELAMIIGRNHPDVQLKCKLILNGNKAASQDDIDKCKAMVSRTLVELDQEKQINKLHLSQTSEKLQKLKTKLSESRKLIINAAPAASAAMSGALVGSLLGPVGTVLGASIGASIGALFGGGGNAEEDATAAVGALVRDPNAEVLKTTDEISRLERKKEELNEKKEQIDKIRTHYEEMLVKLDLYSMGIYGGDTSKR